MASSETNDIELLFEHPESIVDAVADSARRAVLEHKLLGNPIAEWRDGRVVLTPPEEIDINHSPVQAKEADGN